MAAYEVPLPVSVAKFRGFKRIERNGRWIWVDSRGKKQYAAPPPRNAGKPPATRGAGAKHRVMDKHGRWRWKDAKGHFTSPPVDRRTKAQKEEVHKRRPSRTRNQRAAGVSRQRQPVPPIKPDETWDVSKWKLLAGDRRVAIPANLRYTRTYFGPSAGEQAIGYIDDTGLAHSPEYFAVLISPKSGYVYIFIASGPPTSRNRSRRDVRRRKSEGQPMEEDF